MTSKTIQIVGPYFTNYSLAKVNRGLALSINKLNDNYKACVYCDKDQIDWLPSNEEIKKSSLRDYIKIDPIKTDIAIYNNFPKSITSKHNLKELNADVKLMYVAWEDNCYPLEWVNEINENLHGVIASSKFVRDVLLNSGVKVPVKVISNALDSTITSGQVKPFPLKTNKKFKFLHISSAKYRKGVDLLIKAYFSEFTSSDDCCLVIKSFPGPDNLVEQLLNKYRKDDSPEVIHIQDPNLSDEEIAGLNISCDCAVYPTRGEGFGLPILEAMTLKIPVITTSYSGHMDFCNSENSYLLDYKLSISSENEMVNLNSYWAEPNVDQLKNYMKEVFQAKNGDSKLEKILKQKVKEAKKIADTISWENSAKEAISFIKSVEKFPIFKDKNLAVLTFLNDQTGINFYSKELYKNIEKSFNKFYYLSNSDIADRTEVDADNVIRNWSTGESDFNSIANFLIENKINFFHIQYHPGMFPPDSLNYLLNILKELDLQSFVTLHSVKANDFDLIRMCPNLKYAKRVVIHNKEDYEYASRELDNVVLMRIPRLEFNPRNKESLKNFLGLENFSPIISTHGLLNTNKSVDKIIEATHLLKAKYPNVLFLALSAVSSNNIFAGSLLNQLKQQILNLKIEHNVILISEFLDKRVVELLLQTVDINILAYVDTAGESASAAVEKTLASYNPTIVTNIKAFEELNSEVYKIESPEPSEIMNAVVDLLENSTKSESIVKSAKKYIKDYSYLNKAVETLKFYL